MPEENKSHVINAVFLTLPTSSGGRVVWLGVHSGKKLPKAQQTHGIEFFDLGKGTKS